MPLPERYIPINCSFYDRIEAAIVRRKVVHLEYLGPDDEVISVDTLFADTRTRSGEEFLILPSGEEIRMDRILCLDGIPFPRHC